MNYKSVYNIVCRMLAVEAVLLLIPAGVSLAYGEMRSFFCFLITAGITAVLSIPAIIIFRKGDRHALYAKEGLVTVSLAWILWSALGALPFVLEGCIPNYIDALFETVSGFTTTGASILKNIEALPKGMLFWRSFTHWIGGMGVLVFVMTIVPLSDDHSMLLMRAEMPGPTVGKLVPKGKSTAKILYLIYICMTLAEIVFLLFGGMSVFDAFIHAFGTAGTGGFSSYNASIAHFNSIYIEMVIAVFMLLFGINFNIYFFILIRKIKGVLHNDEWKVYLSIIAVATGIIAVATLGIYGAFGTSLRYAFFQVVSFITSTGYVSTSFVAWPAVCRSILLMLMVIGACAGSTGGGLKVSRAIILFRGLKKELHQMLHPKAVSHVKMDGAIVDEKVVKSAAIYFFALFAIIGASAFAVSIDNLSLETNLSAVLSCTGNTGPGYGAASSNFACFSWFSKIILSLDMLFGRLEIFPLLIALTPGVWKKKFF